MNSLELEIIWQEYSDALKKFLHSRVSNSSDVDDLLQEIMLKSYRGLGKLKSRQKLKPWLFQIAQNSLIDFYRQRARKQALKPSLLDFHEEPEHNEIQQDLSDCIIPFIKALPSDQAELLIQIDIHAQSQKDYAQEHKMAYSTLKSRVQKAREQLREVFNDCCDFSVDTHGKVIDYQRKTVHK